MSKLQRALYGLVLPIILAVIWEYWSSRSTSSATIVLPAPSEIALAAGPILFSSKWWWALGRTFGVTLMGFGLGSVTAISLGLVIGQSKWMFRLISPSLLALRSLPIILFVPLALVVFGPDVRVPIILSALVTTLYSTPPIALAVSSYDVERRIFLAARQVSGMQFQWRFILPEVVTALFLSLSLAITLSLAVTVVSEIVLPSLGGVGSEISISRETNRYKTLWAYTILLAFFGWALHSIVLLVFRGAAPWLRGQNAQLFKSRNTLS